MCCNGLLIFVGLLLFFGAAIFVLYQFYSYFIRCRCGNYGPFVSSYGKLKEDILDEARAYLKKSKKKMKIIDLGCGSGALLLPLAKEFPEHEFIGLEWDIVPLTMGKVKAKMRGLANIRFVKGDYMKESHADMDLILCYVHKVTGEPLGKKLAKEIKESAVVISEMFPLYHLEEVKQVQSSLLGIPEKYFVYRKPAKKKETKKKVAKAKPATVAKKKTVKTVAAPKKAAPQKATSKKVAAKKETTKKLTITKKKTTKGTK